MATGDNARANGAQYLAGIVVEIRLKAELVRIYPSVAVQRSHDVTESERPVWNLIWRSHNLTEMLERATTLRASVDAAGRRAGRRAGRPYYEWLADICGRWTIFARVTSVTSTMVEARSMLGRVRLLKEVM